MGNTTHPLVWVDMEMSGLDPDLNRILEVAVVITDAQLNTLAEAPVWIIHQPQMVLDSMDEWCTKTHAASGLTAKVQTATLHEAEAEKQILEFVSNYVPKGKSPLCGNTIWQDRRFMARWMPELEAHFHYRNIDVSTLKELAKRWNPKVLDFKKANKHEALADIYESIGELRHYKEHFLKV